MFLPLSRLELALLEGDLSVGGASSRLEPGTMKELAGLGACIDNAGYGHPRRPLDARDCYGYFPSMRSGTPDLQPPLAERGGGRPGERSVRAPPARKKQCGSGWAGTFHWPSGAAVSSEELVERVCASPGPEAFLSYPRRAGETRRPGFVDSQRNLALLMANIDHPQPTMPIAARLPLPPMSRACVSTRSWSSTPTRSIKYQLITTRNGISRSIASATPLPIPSPTAAFPH